MQIAHYSAILRRNGHGGGTCGFILDRTGGEVSYDLNARGTSEMDLAEQHLSLLARARAIRDGTGLTKPALSSDCSLCHWRSSCRQALVEAGDLTLIPQLGRSLRLRSGRSLGRSKISRRWTSTQCQRRRRAPSPRVWAVIVCIASSSAPAAYASRS